MLVAALAVAACTADVEADDGAEATDDVLAPAGVSASDLGARIVAASLEAGTATAEVTADGGDGTVVAEVAYRFSESGVDLAARAQFSDGLLDAADLLLVDDELYVEVPAAYRVFVGTPWLRLPRDGGFAEQAESLLDSLAASVPGEELVGSSASVSQGEPERVDGDWCDPYEVAGPGTTITYWLAADDLPCRVQAGGEQSPDATQVVTYRDWGGEVTIEAPADDEVGELAG